MTIEILTRMAMQVAIYALLETAIEVDLLLSWDHGNGPFPVQAMYISSLFVICHFAIYDSTVLLLRSKLKCERMRE